MLGMNFISFLILLIISIVVSAILHYGVKMYVVPGTRSFLSKIIIGWIGAWLGSPILGNWWTGLSYGQVYYVPAILGSFALLILAVDVVETVSKACGGSSSAQGQS